MLLWPRRSLLLEHFVASVIIGRPMALYAPTWSCPGVLLFTVDCRRNVLFYCSRLATRNRQLLSRPQPRVLGVLSNNSPARQLERLFVSRQISAQSGRAELVNLRVKHDPSHIYPPAPTTRTRVQTSPLLCHHKKQP